METLKQLYSSSSSDFDSNSEGESSDHGVFKKKKKYTNSSVRKKKSEKKGPTKDTREQPITDFNHLNNIQRVQTESKSSRKRKTQIDSSEVRSPKIARHSPLKHSSPVVKACSGKKSVQLETTSEKAYYPRYKKVKKPNCLINCVSDSNHSDSPKRLSAKKNLFSPKKDLKSVPVLRISLNRCLAFKNEQNNGENGEDDQNWSLAKCNTVTPQKNNERVSKQGKCAIDGTYDGGNRTPEKYKVQQNDFEVECKSVKLLNESSPTKKTLARKDISSPESCKRMRSTSKLSTVASSNESPSSESQFENVTPRKEIMNTSVQIELKRLAIDMKHSSVESPRSRTNKKSCEVSSPGSLRRASTSKRNRVSLLDNVRDVNRTPRKKANVCENDDENENTNCISKQNYSTPNKKENQILFEEKHTPFSSSKQNEMSDCIKKLASPLQAKMLTATTPVSKKSTGRGFLTPSMAKREHCTNDMGDDALDMTRKQLHISTIPKSLPCRETEFSQVKSFLIRKIEHKVGGCMYISGVPGTGKTATIHAVIRSLQQEVDEGELPDFNFVEVNGLRLTEPRQAYVRIYQALTDQKLTPDQAQQLLNKRFSGTCKKSTIILVDELDYLCNRRQDVVYNILDWPTKRSSGLVVLTISNTMDLPERTLKGRVTSRMGLTRLVFHPYSHHQLREIVLDRLCGSTAFHPDAVQLVARKVAAVSGDARRALDICRRTTELVQSGEQVTATHVERALTQIFSGPRVTVIQNLSRLAQLVLRSLRDVNQRTGIEEATVAQVYRHLHQICVLEGCVVPVVGLVLETCVALVGLGLVVAERGRMDITRKLSLNVSSDDIHYALDNVKSNV